MEFFAFSHNRITTRSYGGRGRPERLVERAQAADAGGSCAVAFSDRRFCSRLACCRRARPTISPAERRSGRVSGNDSDPDREGVAVFRRRGDHRFRSDRARRNESVVSAVAIRNEQLAEIAAPLLDRGFIPRQVTVYAAQRASTHAPKGNALLIYPEGETLVYAMTENGKLSLARVFENGNGEQLQLELPQLRMSAELQGINASFPNVLMDESCYQMREAVEGILASPTEIVGIELPPAAVKLNLLPESWRRRRSQVIRQAEWRKRLVLIGGAYVALLLLLFAYLGLLRFQIGSFDRRIARDAPGTQFVRATEANWKALAPAIDARYYPVEILLHFFESLPSPEVRITAYNQSARQISVDGEANTAALAYQFIEKIKKNPDLRVFQFDMAAPRILPNDHAQFRLEGKPR